ncbi:MAG: phosphate uptake regulator PhoU [Nitrosarchaeum sp.]|nr:phosphate uptake regulator PhoU [Nitrosarchaeum sp.]
MTRLIDPSLQKLSFIMSEMGDMVIESISLAIDSYLEGVNTKSKVLELSDAIRNKYFEVEDLTFDMLLKYQPVADDFRLIRSSTEISYAFSRFGRYAYDITLVRDLFGDVSECTNASLVQSSNLIKQLIKQAVMSFAELDIRKAAQIRQDERIIDRIYKDRLPKLIESKNTRCALAEALLLRYLERIGDHAVFMSDAINYIVTGKHRPSEERIASHTKPE